MGQELLTENGKSTGILAMDYIDAIEGIGREDLFYGHQEDNQPTPLAIREQIIPFLDIAEREGVEV